MHPIHSWSNPFLKRCTSYLNPPLNTPSPKSSGLNQGGHASSGALPQWTFAQRVGQRHQIHHTNDHHDSKVGVTGTQLLQKRLAALTPVPIFRSGSTSSTWTRWRKQSPCQNRLEKTTSCTRCRHRQTQPIPACAIPHWCTVRTAAFLCMSAAPWCRLPGKCKRLRKCPNATDYAAHLGHAYNNCRAHAARLTQQPFTQNPVHPQVGNCERLDFII